MIRSLVNWNRYIDRVYIEGASSRCLNAPPLCTDADDLLLTNMTLVVSVLPCPVEDEFPNMWFGCIKMPTLGNGGLPTREM